MIRNIRTHLLRGFVGALLLSGMMTSCRDNDDAYQTPEVTISGLTDEGLSYATEGESSTFTLQANHKWSISNTAAWLNVSPKEGAAGSHTITVKALPNTGSARSAQLTVKTGIKTQAIKITQAGANNPVDPKVEGMPLVDFLAKYDKGEEIASIAEDVTFEAVVLTDVAQSNQPFSKIITLQAGEVGIPVILKEDIRDLKVGEVVRIKAQGAKIAYFNGVTLQLNLPSNSSIVRTNEIRSIEPKKLTIQEIYSGKYDNILVSVEGVQFVNPNGTMLLNSKTTNHPITDCKPTPAGKNKVSVTVFKPAKFASESIPTKRGRITGILQLTKDKNDKSSIRFYNIAIRNMADLQLTEERCNEDEGGNTPPPNPNPTPAGIDLMIITYVEGSANNKYLQIYNPTDKEIDLEQGAYSLRMENFSKDGEVGAKPSGVKTLNLTGKIAPKATKVYANTAATLYTGEQTTDKDALGFNGNDNIAIFKAEAMIDIIGVWGSVWVDGKNGAGKDITLYRKTSINKPNPTYTADEWETLPKDDITKLGKR